MPRFRSFPSPPSRRFEGQGIRSYPDGSRYEGDWRGGRRNGQGAQKWPNGHSYVGGWKDDKASGTGTLTDETGAAYTGTWMSGCLRRTARPTAAADRRRRQRLPAQLLTGHATAAPVRRFYSENAAPAGRTWRWTLPLARGAAG